MLCGGFLEKACAFVYSVLLCDLCVRGLDSFFQVRTGGRRGLYAVLSLCFNSKVGMMKMSCISLTPYGVQVGGCRSEFRKADV